MRGGKMAGQGGYGCGFFPAIPCNGQNKTEDGFFSKLMLEKNADIEMMMTMHIRRIDPEQKYSIYSKEACEPNYQKLLDDEVEKCSHLFKNFKKSQIAQLFKSESFRILQLPFGGEQIDKIKIPKENLNKLLISFQNLFKGLQKMHSNRLYHFDIKPNNILAMEKDGKYLTRFIDFGLSRTADEFLKDKEFPIDHPYEWWPYEFRFYSPFINTQKVNLNDIDDMYLQNASIIRDGPPWMPSGVYFYAGDQIEARDYYENIINSITNDIKNNGIDTFVKYLEKVDVFGLGAALAAAFYSQTGFVYKYDIAADEEKVFRMDSRGTMHDVKNNDDIIIARAFYEIIKGMIHRNPIERHDVSTALKKYQEFLTYIGNLKIIELDPVNLISMNSPSKIETALAPFSSNPAKLGTPGLSPIQIYNNSKQKAANNTTKKNNKQHNNNKANNKAQGNNFNELSRNITLMMGEMSPL